jgi:hypothetical protein
MKHKVWGAVVLVIAVFYAFTNPSGAAGAVKSTMHAAGQFLGVLTR